MQYEKIENPVINPLDWVTVTDMGHLKEVQYLQRRNNEATIIKLDKDHYSVVKTGETKTFQHSENRKDSLNSLRQTFKKLRYLINANFKGNNNELHCVLTYSENMTDVKRLYSDVKNFVLRLKYYFKDSTSVDYINVVEPQGRGAWHCHLLLRFNDVDSIFIPNAELQKMWGQGFVTIKSLRNVDNIGAYLSAYLSDIELDENSALTGTVIEKLVNNSDGTVTSKKVIKGARLHLYPTGMRLYRKSKGIIEPTRNVMLYSSFKKKVGESANPHYRSGIHLSDDGYENNIIYEQYNLKRSKNQS